MAGWAGAQGREEDAMVVEQAFWCWWGETTEVSRVSGRGRFVECPTSLYIVIRFFETSA